MNVVHMCGLCVHANNVALCGDTVSDVALFFYFYLYIYPPDSQESDGGACLQWLQLPRPASGDAKILLSASNLRDITVI